jgi:hypothetical protein
VADEILRDDFKRSKYPDVILPFTVLTNHPPQARISIPSPCISQNDLALRGDFIA